MPQKKHNMDSRVITYIQQATNTRGLHEKKWQEIVNEVVLPKMAGKGEKPIKEDLLHLMAIFSYSIQCEDLRLHEVLLEICLQRISKGAINHDYLDYPPIDVDYREYSSMGREKAGLTPAVVNFILSNAINTAVVNKALRSHALMILFGIIRNGYHIPKCIDFITVKEMREKALSLVKRYATWEELFDQLAREEIWEEHKMLLSENYEKINWDKFFLQTKMLNGNFFQRWRQKRRIKKEIKTYALPVAGY